MQSTFYIGSSVFFFPLELSSKVSKCRKPAYIHVQYYLTYTFDFTQEATMWVSLMYQINNMKYNYRALMIIMNNEG